MTQTATTPAVSIEVVDAIKYAEVMKDSKIYKQYCLKEKVGISRIKRILLAMQKELGKVDIAGAVVKYQTMKKEAGSLVDKIALSLNMSTSTIAEELSEVVCSKNRAAVCGFVHSSFHQFLDIGEACYYTSTRNKFIKEANAKAAVLAAKTATPVVTK